MWIFLVFVRLLWSFNKRCPNRLYYRIPYFIGTYYFFKTVVAVLPHNCSKHIQMQPPHLLGGKQRTFLFPSSIIVYSRKYHCAYKPLSSDGCYTDETGREKEAVPVPRERKCVWTRGRILCSVIQVTS